MNVDPTSVYDVGSTLIQHHLPAGIVSANNVTFKKIIATTCIMLPINAYYYCEKFKKKVSSDVLKKVTLVNIYIQGQWEDSYLSYTVPMDSL